MKILIVNKFLYPRGGAETYVFKIGQYLEKQGHKVQYFGMYDEKNIAGNELGLGTASMDFRSRKPARLLYPFRILYSIEAKEKIKHLVKHFRPDVIHLNNINFHLTPSVIDGAFDLGIPMVQTVHDFQMICPNHMMLDMRKKMPCDKCIAGSRWNCVINKCIHNSYIKSILGCLEGTIYRYSCSYDKVSQYICPSRFMEQMLLRDKRYRGKTIVLQNFIQRREENITPEKQDYVLYFGRYSEEKGIKTLLEVCRKLPEIQFVFAGKGPMESEVDKVENIRNVGFLTGKMLDKVISEARFVVYPSECYENCPFTIMESLAYGTPVLGADIGGIPELITNGKTGELFESKNEQDLNNRILRLWNNEDVTNQYAANCKEEKLISIEKYYEEVMKIYVAGRKNVK